MSDLAPVAGRLFSERRPGVVLPTVQGMVHGIVGGSPVEVQCCKCLVVRSGDTKMGGAQIILADIKFNPRAKSDQRRLCRECREEEWPRYEN